MAARRLGALVAMGCVLAAGACAAASVPAGTVPPAAVPSADAVTAGIAAGHCPATNPPYLRNPAPGLTDNPAALVPVHAYRLVLCRYGGLEGGAWPVSRLAATRTLTNAGTVRAFQRRFNALRPVPRGGYYCPNDDDSAILAGFVASRTSYTVVRVSLRGCQWAGNGRATRLTGGSGDATFLADLQRLTPG